MFFIEFDVFRLVVRCVCIGKWCGDAVGLILLNIVDVSGLPVVGIWNGQTEVTRFVSYCGALRVLVDEKAYSDFALSMVNLDVFEAGCRGQENLLGQRL